MPVDIMIAGSQKSGTTSLLAYLRQHPSIEAQGPREMTWFTDGDARAFPEEFYFGAESATGLRLGKLAGLMYQSDAIERLAEHNPKAEVVVILRDPVKRAYSSYWHMRGRGRDQEHESFEDAVREGMANPSSTASSPTAYIEWSRYENAVRPLQARFGEAFSVLIFEEFVADPLGVVTPLLDRWGLDTASLGSTVPRENPSGTLRSPTAAKLARGKASRLAGRVVPSTVRAVARRQYAKRNLTAQQTPPIDPATEAQLRELFREPNRRLEELLGRPITVWGERSDPAT